MSEIPRGFRARPRTLPAGLPRALPAGLPRVHPRSLARQFAGVVCAAAILLGLVAAGRPALHAQGPDLIEVDVTVRGIARLYGADIRLHYDPEQVTLVDSMSGRPGTQIVAGRGWGPAPFVLVNEADVAVGTVHFAALLMAPAAALEGDVVIATLRLAPRRLEPEDAWALTAVELVDRRGQPLESDWDVVEIHPRIDWPNMRAWSFLPRLDG